VTCTKCGDHGFLKDGLACGCEATQPFIKHKRWISPGHPQWGLRECTIFKHEPGDAAIEESMRGGGWVPVEEASTFALLRQAFWDKMFQPVVDDLRERWERMRR
jgi:hypothetical protein